MKLLQSIILRVKQLRARVAFRRRLKEKARRIKALSEPRRFFSRRTSSVLVPIKIGSRNVRTTGINLPN